MMSDMAGNDSSVISGNAARSILGLSFISLEITTLAPHGHYWRSTWIYSAIQRTSQSVKRRVVQSAFEHDRTVDLDQCTILMTETFARRLFWGVEICPRATKTSRSVRHGIARSDRRFQKFCCYQLAVHLRVSLMAAGRRRRRLCSVLHAWLPSVLSSHPTERRA